MRFKAFLLFALNIAILVIGYSINYAQEPSHARTLDLSMHSGAIHASQVLSPTLSVPSDLRAPSPPATCGPLSNYTIKESVGATIVPGVYDVSYQDAANDLIDLPFPVRLYDKTFYDAMASPQGNLQFDGNVHDTTDDCLPTRYFYYSIIPHFDDTATTAAGSGVFTSVTGVAPNRIFNIEWRVNYEAHAGRANYEVRLYEGQNKFDIIYGQLSENGANVRVGVQKWPDDLYTSYACNTGTLRAGLMLTFTQPVCGTSTPTPTGTWHTATSTNTVPPPTSTHTPFVSPTPTSTPTSTSTLAPTFTATTTPTETPTPTSTPTADPDLEPGFPVKVIDNNNFSFQGPSINTLVGNIDADPELEILASTGGAGGALYAWNSDGSPVQGWPIKGQFLPALSDLSASPGDEVLSISDDGLTIHSESGAVLPGWPALTSLNSHHAPILADVDGDGLDEIFIDRYAFKSDGSTPLGWPQVWWHATAVGDLDGDGRAELVTAPPYNSAGGSLHAYHDDGTAVAGFPISFRYSGAYPAIGDVDKDGENEVVVVASNGFRPVVLVISADGQVERTITLKGDLNHGTGLALSDIDTDGAPEIIVQAEDALNVVKGDGTPLPGWPQIWDDTRFGNSAPVIGDVDGDGLPDIVITTQEGSSNQGAVRVYNRSGQMHPRFPKPLPIGPGVVPAIADIDHDGRNEIIISGNNRDELNKVWVFDLHGPGPYGPVLWGQFGGGPKHQHSYPTPRPGSATVTPRPTKEPSRWLSTALLSRYCGPVQDTIKSKTFLCMDSTGGDYIGQGRDWLATSEEATFTLHGSGWTGIDVSVANAQGWRISFAPPTDRVLGVGRYEGAERVEFRSSASKPGLDVSGDHRGCNKLSGRFNIYDVSYSEDGTIKRFSADFEQSCDNGPSLLGMIRYEAPASEAPVPAAHSTAEMPSSPLTAGGVLSAINETVGSLVSLTGTLVTEALSLLLPFFIPFFLCGTIAVCSFINTSWTVIRSSMLKTVWALWIAYCVCGWLTLLGALTVGIFNGAVVEYTLSGASRSGILGQLVAQSELAVLVAVLLGLAIMGALIGAVSGATQGWMFRQRFPDVKWRMWAIVNALVWPGMFMASLMLGLLSTYIFLGWDAIPGIVVCGAALGVVLAKKITTFVDDEFVETTSAYDLRGEYS